MILITGCSGLVGSSIARKYLEEGHTVRAFKRENTDLSNLSDIVAKIEWIETDLFDVVKIKQALEGIDTVIHAAAVVSFNQKDRNIIYQTNVIGTTNMIDACLAKGIKKFIYISSIAALGRSKNNESSINESQKWQESKYNSYYAKSKYLGELEVWRGFEEGLNGFIVNPSIILGYGDWNKSSCALFKQIYKHSKHYPIGTLNYIDVSDVSNILYSLDNSGINHEKYILNAGQIKYHTFYYKVAKVFNLPLPSHRINKTKMKLFYYFDSLIYMLTGRKQTITKELITNFGRSFSYENHKVKKQLNYNFRNIDESIAEICTKFLKNKS